MPILLPLLAAAIAQPCEPQWGGPFPSTGASKPVATQAVFDEDGPGPKKPALFVGGMFSHLGDQGLPYLGRWTGAALTPAGGVPDAPVSSMSVFDEDGPGPKRHALFVGGSFTSIGGKPLGRIGRWNGGAWSALPPLPKVLGYAPNNVVLVKALDPDAGGPAPIALFVISEVNFGSDGSSFGYQKWDGAAWTDLGSEIAGTFGAHPIHDFAGFDPPGPTPPGLYAAGSAGFRRWSGSEWILITPPNKPEHSFSSIAAFDPDGTGPSPNFFYLGGNFDSIGKILANNIARWDGTNWTWVGDGLGKGGSYGVTQLRVLDLDAAGPLKPALIAAGLFGSAGGKPANSIAVWTGQAWSPVPGGVTTTNFLDKSIPGLVTTFTVFDPDAAGPATVSLHVGGSFDYAGGRRARNFAAWDGADWSAVGPGLSGDVLAFALYNDGTGRTTYAGGRFATIGGRPLNHIARWDGATWQPLGGGLNAGAMVNRGVWALAAHTDASGHSLYAGGEFLKAGAVTAPRIARWNGKQWSAVGTGMNGLVTALASHDDGSGGAALYAAGNFTAAGGVSAIRVAKWNGASWSPLGSGLNGMARTLRSFDDGAGPALYAGGEFTQAGGAPALSVAKWAGGAWSPLPGIIVGPVCTLAIYDAGEGPRLHAGGYFAFGNGNFDKFIGRWDGGAWKATTSQSPFPYGRIHALRVFDDGNGPALFAGGDFKDFEPPPDSMRYIARLRDGVWSPSGMPDRPVLALGTPDDAGDGLSMFVGGSFTYISGIRSGRVTRLFACAPTAAACAADCDGDGALDIDDFLCFQALFAAGDDAADCDGDGALGVEDFICFQTTFAAGCS